jgi:hypothetical protein
MQPLYILKWQFICSCCIWTVGRFGSHLTSALICLRVSQLPQKDSSARSPLLPILMCLLTMSSYKLTWLYSNLHLLS